MSCALESVRISFPARNHALRSRQFQLRVEVIVEYSISYPILYKPCEPVPSSPGPKESSNDQSILSRPDVPKGLMMRCELAEEASYLMEAEVATCINIKGS